jgi:hypothetical protein
MKITANVHTILKINNEVVMIGGLSGHIILLNYVNYDVLYEDDG